MFVQWVNHLRIDSAEVAAAIGVIVLILLVSPVIIAGLGQGMQVRHSIIQRHSNKLKNESMRHVRGARSNERKVRHSWPLVRLVALWPERILREKQKLLRAAGFFEERAFFVFWSVKTTAFLIFIALAIAKVFSLFGNAEGTLKFDALIVFSVLFFFGVDTFVRWMKVQRLKRLMRGLPDALDLLVICAEAGLSLDAGLRRVAEEFVTAVPELSEELLLTSVELNFLPDRRQALANLAQRVDVPAMRGVTSTLIQTEKYGTPLSAALRTLSSEYRETRLLRAEEKAARLPAILTVPMICFILPALFIVLAAPAFIKVAENFG